MGKCPIRSVSRVKCTLDSWPITECARGGESLSRAYIYIYAKEFYEDASVKIRGARKTGIESVSKESQSGGGAFESLI